jgi:hypothetical protein
MILVKQYQDNEINLHGIRALPRRLSPDNLLGRDMSPGRFVHDNLPQGFYDAFNQFVFSPDHKVFDKLLSKNRFLGDTASIPGAILELGVFKGSGMAVWLKCLKSLGLNRKVYGFDIFNSELLDSNIHTEDRALMASLFADRGFEPKDYELVLDGILRGAGFENFELVSGDIFETLPLFLAKNPGFRASIINFDMDTAEPTLFALEQLWPRLVPGGVALFDEYAINEWTESNAVDEFIARGGLKLEFTNYESPSAFVFKS